MKKIIILMIIITMLISPTASMAAGVVDAIGSPQDLTLNGKVQDVVGFNIKDYNYFRLRDLANVLKYEDFNFSLWGDNKKIIINLDQKYDDQGNTKVENKVGLKKKALPKNIKVEIIKNNNLKTENVEVFNIDGYNYFKLRDMGSLLGFNVDYNQAKNQAQMTVTKTVETVGITETVKPPKPVENNNGGKVVLGNERLLEEFSHLINGKNVGLITNQTGIDSKGIRTVDKLYNYNNAKLKAVYSPEHGLDGIIKAGAYVESYQDTRLNLPVFSLYGKTREPSKDMLKGIDVLVFDIQDIGSRTYTYVSTMNYAMRAAAKYNIPFIVLDRPNPVGGDIVEGFMLEDKYKTFVGVDNMPMAHGMTIGELANYYNRNIKSKLTVIPMKNYRRSMIWQDTGLPFAQTSPNIPNLASAFNYMAAGIGDGTGVGQSDKFGWVGGKNINSEEFARILNGYNLPGVTFKPENKGTRGGVKITITDYHKYNPARCGTYVLATANLISEINIPSEKDNKIPMFEKIHGCGRMGEALRAKKTPEQIVSEYERDVQKFKELRKPYLIYN